mmetsp:Transcript_26499/g.39359  ORF Transcript_26499/g.39359 Transcript_26499/m.39359 type:complete len:230 (-) Transcript_26499:2101-2790(-)
MLYRKLWEDISSRNTVAKLTTRVMAWKKLSPTTIMAAEFQYVVRAIRPRTHSKLNAYTLKMSTAVSKFGSNQCVDWGWIEARTTNSISFRMPSTLQRGVITPPTVLNSRDSKNSASTRRFMNGLHQTDWSVSKWCPSWLSFLSLSVILLLKKAPSSCRLWVHAIYHLLKKLFTMSKKYTIGISVCFRRNASIGLVFGRMVLSLLCITLSLLSEDTTSFTSLSWHGTGRT